MTKKQTTPKATETKYQVVGWILFIICAIFFIASSLANQDVLTFIGSVIFLVACIVFLIPILKAPKPPEDDTS